MVLLHHIHMNISMKGRSFKIGVAMASHKCVLETNSESRMGGVLDETAFRPLNPGTILKIIVNRGFECFFSHPHTAQL